MLHEHTKHLDIDCHIVREKSQSGLMRLLPVFSLDHRANIFTKALSFKSFTNFLPKLGMQDIFQPQACGGVSEVSHINELS